MLRHLQSSNRSTLYGKTKEDSQNQQVLALVRAFKVQLRVAEFSDYEREISFVWSSSGTQSRLPHCESPTRVTAGLERIFRYFALTFGLLQLVQNRASLNNGIYVMAPKNNSRVVPGKKYLRLLASYCLADLASYNHSSLRGLFAHVLPSQCCSL
ncbi:hypothetical protein KL930_005336 [Ogataea haglerorum]|nr:hypothetical protein KL915_002744 [Ogataea haglerorum]KAG7772442.1 hypothetical protein KL930_005336 [Ogataea haglerorum]KAG7773533.1 hypothetical protein KL922_005272 [Ogataea haglerorum]KAG7787450.1 hypothetical protein KL945_003109 [Ogataea haglerorum]